MNKILALFAQGKFVKTFDDICDIVFANNGGRQMNQLPAELSLSRKCAEVGYRVAMFEYVRRGIPMGAIPDAELVAYAKSLGNIYHSIILAGDVKLLHLMRKDAIEFVNATAYTQDLDEAFFLENFTKPIVLYSESVPLIKDIKCVVMFYDAEEKKVCCVFSKKLDEMHEQEFGGEISVEELTGRLLRSCLDDLMNHEGGSPALEQINNESEGLFADMLYDSMLFALKFVLLLKTDKQPLITKRQYKQHKNESKEREARGYLSHQVVALTTKYVQAMRSWKPTDRISLDKEGKKLVRVGVHAFIRKQHYGPQNSLIKFVHIDAHDRDVWVREGIRIISVVR